ncbi:MAG TPA: potassium-transporting ATPase subunit KdpA [Acidimicrobiales bacterium]|jgi:K+-transporting ATPase ATPase A chain|nr:potassium-transporting ATPase subunit KdpA [Acidimicrobiales bacterium]
MTGLDWGQFLAIGVVTVVVAPLLGRYLAATFRGGPAPGDRVFLPVERLAYRFTGIDPDSSQTWKGYAIAVVAFGAVSTLFLYAVLLLQGVLPFNPTHAPGMSPALSFNTAVSFVTGTDWQAYSGETQASYLAQMAGLVVAQFTAAAVGISVALAVIRGISGRARTIGNFWADLTRSLVRVFVPLSVIAALVLVSQGAVQNFSGFRTATTVAGGTQHIPGGPVASMEVIKLLGTNGGSFYGAGGAHPFENPTGFTNMFDLLLVIVLPFAIALMFGRLIGNRRQGRAIAAVMAILFVGLTLISMQAEAHGNQLLPTRVSQLASSHNIGGSMEGKESRFGPGGSALMTVGTMGTTAGATDSSLDSYTPIGGAGAFVAILLGEVSPGGDGGGLYSILVLALLAVFLAGLMVGRTPEFLGKKIRASQMKLIIAYVLALPITILVLGSLSLVMAVGTRSILNPGMHGLTEVTYAFASSAQNNGSAFAGLSANTPWYNTMLGLTMLIGRFVPIVLALAIAGSLAGARVHARTRATLDTTGPTFVAFLLGVILIMGGLIYLPMLILGPIGERIVG